MGDLASEASGPITASACTSMFCEDFEKATLDTAAWSTNDGNKGVIVQTVKFAHGQRAVKLHVDPNSRRAYIVTKNAPAGLRSHLFGRAYYYMAATQVQGHGPSIWAGRANGPFTSVELIGGAGGAALLGIGGSGDRGGTDGGKILFDRWMCIEWEFNDQPGQATLWFDGKKMGMTPPFSSNGGLVEMAFGINLYAGTVNGPTDLYLDDIALDTQRIGCM